jgi:hypothetical protein
VVRTGASIGRHRDRPRGRGRSGIEALETLLIAVPAAVVAVGLALYLARRRRPVAALWAVVDRSIGMWIVRRLTGRPDPASARPGPDVAIPSDQVPAADEIAYRIGVPVAYIATGTNFPDALAGAAAGGHRGGPVLLVNPAVAALPSATAAELTRLRPRSIIVLGSAGAVPDSIFNLLQSYVVP